MFVYLAGPMTKYIVDPEGNVNSTGKRFELAKYQLEMVTRIEGRMTRNGYICFNPYGSIFSDYVSDSTAWYDADLKWMEVINNYAIEHNTGKPTIILFPGWQTSKGAQGEYKFAYNNNWTMLEYDPEDDELILMLD